MIKFLLLLFIPCLALGANNLKVIYGDDNRTSYSNASSRHQELSDATAGMIRSSALKKSGSYYNFKSYQYGGRLIGNMWENAPICMSERFAHEKTLPTCSGFLIADDILVTAGHCVTSESTCSSVKWIFGYTKKVALAQKIHRDNVYSCKKILQRGDGPKDFAVLKLDRSVSGRYPLRISKKRVKLGDKLMAIGHPSGLPTKISDGASVSKLSKYSFKTNLDTFSSSSGSAVLNSSTGKVVGILVSGAEDFIKDEREGCYKVNRCDNRPSHGSCLGESVTRISVIKELDSY